MDEHELWVTALFNNYLAAPANAALALIGRHAADPSKPWANFVAMEFLVVLLILMVFAILRSQLSMDRPGIFQQVFELIYEFLHGQAEEGVGPEGPQFIAWFGTLFIFILFSNLIGVIPSLESPTMFPAVPAGCAVATFLYYNIWGIRKQGLGHYIAHFAGPVPWLAPLMFPIEIISHLTRPLSLTIRLYANMLAGEKVTLIFLALAPALIPSVFMGLHVFVSLIQAYIFTVLTILYVGGAIAQEEGHGEAEHGGHSVAEPGH